MAKRPATVSTNLGQLGIGEKDAGLALVAGEAERFLEVEKRGWTPCIRPDLSDYAEVTRVEGGTLDPNSRVSLDEALEGLLRYPASVALHERTFDQRSPSRHDTLSPLVLNVYAVCQFWKDQTETVLAALRYMQLN